MKVRSGLEMLLPTVQYGNLKLLAEVAVDTVTDLGRIEEAQKSLGVNGDKNSNEVVAEVARRMAVEELVKMKREVDKLTETTFQLKK